MRFIKFSILTTLLFFSVGINAMPPHPDVIDEYQKSGQLKTLMNRVDAINTKMNMNSPLKTFPASGVRRVPVLLVIFDTPYEASSNLFFNFNDKNNLPLYGLFIFFISALFLMYKRNGELNGTVLKPFIPVLYLSLFIFIISCGTTKNDDEDEFPTDPDVYSSLLNGESSSDLSLKKYYLDMSDNTLNLQFDVYGPVKVSNSWDYYGKNSGSNDLHPGELAGEALRLMVSKYSSVNFANYDNDKNGDVDTVIIIHQGPGEESSVGVSDTIWSHQWDLKSAALSGDGNGPVNAGKGTLFNIYTMQPEYTTVQGDSTIGVFAHEFGHVLGLPDLYDTSKETGGVGDWSLMASGSWKGPGALKDGSTPSPLLSWERFKAGGTNWITVTDLTVAGTQPITDIETSKVIYKLSLDVTSGEEQYLLIEGKVQSTSSTWYVPGTGILVTHIHEGVISHYTALDTINAGSGRIHGVNVLESGGGTSLWSTSYSGTAADLFVPGDTLTAKKYTSSYPSYSLLPMPATSVTINTVLVTTVPVSFNFTL